MPYLPESLSLSAQDITALISDYKEYHASPELSLAEFETTRKIRERAQTMKLDDGVEREIVEVSETGTVVVLRNGEGPTIAYRADIDALPLKEQTGLDYASTVTADLDGDTVPVMHGCGHDAHIVMGLKTMELFARSGKDWSGTLEFIFQPAEEGKGGAQVMLQAGLWKKIPLAQALYGQHVFPFPAGQIITTKDEFTASVDSLKITLHGSGGHGSQPQDTVDPVVLASYIVVRLQSIVSRVVAPMESAVVTVGSIYAGQKENIIPDTAEMRLSVRASTQEVREKVLSSIERIVRAESEASGAGEPEINNFHSSAIVNNDEELSKNLADVLTQELDTEVIYDPNFRLMGSEDFGELGDAENIPYSFWGLGSFSDELMNSESPISNHSPFFAPQPEVTLETGVRAALSALYSHTKKA